MRPDSSLPGSEQLRELFFSHQRITKVNDAMVAQYGTSREKLIGLTPGDFYAHDREYGKQVWQTFFDAGRLHTDADEHRFDGTPIRIEGDYICLLTANTLVSTESLPRNRTTL